MAVKSFSLGAFFGSNAIQSVAHICSDIFIPYCLMSGNAFDLQRSNYQIRHAQFSFKLKAQLVCCMNRLSSPTL